MSVGGKERGYYRRTLTLIMRLNKLGSLGVPFTDVDVVVGRRILGEVSKLDALVVGPIQRCQLTLNKPADVTVPLVLQAVRTWRIFDFEAPELDEDRWISDAFPDSPNNTTYDPSRRLAVHKLLSVRPLFHELVRGIEVGRDGPFTDPHRGVPSRIVPLNPVEVWGCATLALASFRVKFKLGGGCLLHMLVK